MNKDPSVAIIKPGPHRAKRIRKSAKDPTKTTIVVVTDQGSGGPLRVPPAVKIDL